MAGRTSPTARLAAGVVALLLNVAMAEAQQPALQPQGGAGADTTAIAIDDKSIGGVVTSRFGPEAGVWVIAETTAFETRFARIAVTDEAGRYVIPDLPKAPYRLWVRGYGLVDLKKVAAELGKRWTSRPSSRRASRPRRNIIRDLLGFAHQSPGQEPLPRHRGPGNGVPENLRTQEQWLDFVKTNGCGTCHQLGNFATRTFPAAFGHFASSLDAWSLGFGRDSRARHAEFHRAGDNADGGHLAALADWTDRIKAGGCRMAARRGQSASSEISSSRCAIGSTRSITCTI